MKTILFIIGIVIALIIFWLITNKIKIKYKTFKEKGFAPKRGDFGIYCYTGSQGKGKTYSLVEYIIDNKEKIEVFSNISGIQGVNFTYYVGFKGLIDIKNKLDNGELKTDKQLLIIYDEIFTELQKGSKLSSEVLDFLCQMRKRKIIFMTTAQYWAEIPITFRRFCRYQIDCNMINFLGIGLLFKAFHDAENMKWNNDTQEHEAPLIETTLSHCRKSIANSYDTFLRISSVVATTSEPRKEDKKIDNDFWEFNSKDVSYLYENDET